MYLLYLAQPSSIRGVAEPKPVAVAPTKELLHKYALKQVQKDPDWLGGPLKLKWTGDQDADYVLEDDVGEIWGWIITRIKLIRRPQVIPI